MFDRVELIIHHGGNFVSTPTMYLGGEVDIIKVDPDFISYTHLMKSLKSGSYGNICGLYYKTPEQPMEMLHELFNDATTLDLIYMGTRCGKCEIYVHHSLDEAELVEIPLLPVPTTNANGKPVPQHDEEPVIGDHADVDQTSEGLTSHDAEEEYKTKSDTSEGEDSVEYDSSNPRSYNGEPEIHDQPREHFCTYNPDCEPPNIQVGMYFEDGTQFKSALVRYAVHEKRDIKFAKNEPHRVRVKCGGTCSFSCTGTWVERLKCFQVSVFNQEHQCNLKYKLEIVSQKWIAEKFEDKVVDDPTMTALELKKLIKAELKKHVSTSMATRALRIIQKKTQTVWKEQFKKIRNYAEECLQSIPDSTMVIHTTRVVPDSPSIFQRIYVCFGPVKKGFLEGCRKVVGLDGCFLKGQLKREILSAVGRDANNQMYPIAWAVVEIENNSSWAWFLELLKTDLQITRSDLWTIISDQQKGLCNVIARVFPEAEHRNCARHIHANWSKTHRGLLLKNLFWMCAKSTCEEQLQTALAELDKADSDAGKDLRKIDFKLWCKAYFRTDVKCDTVENNLSEAFNSTLLKCRGKPIIPMLEDIRVAMMKRIAKKRKYVKKWSGIIFTSIGNG
ncbi:unnamed protein product [Cuscuta europaea]|uniref:MULE transposase domain-containing protein n=1 Tax=Cuscuta europaea TaxID=41803 RepID=A0A9P0Z297_CUSEU|nr:unnamed protein product [Cuscuta europaea]